MTSHNELQSSDRPTSEAQDLPRLGRLPRIPSNLSQASTLVGSESPDSRFDGPEPTTSSPDSASHNTSGENHSGGAGDGRAPDLETHDKMRKEELDCKAARNKALDEVRALHVLCDPVVELVESVNWKMGAAERLLEREEGEDYDTARKLFIKVLREIERFNSGSS